MRRILAALALIAATSPSSPAHDIPNARVDRSIQAVLSPGRLRVDYEMSLSELTLTQELRQLIGELPGADRQGWFAAYGRETGPLNAKGLLVAVDGEPVDLKAVGFVLAVEEHPRYTFHFEAEIPPRGRLRLNDTNFAASEGTSRLALRASPEIVIAGDSLPADVLQIPARPVWQLSDAEERRTRQLTVSYAPATSTTTTQPATTRPTPPVVPAAETTARPTGGLSRLLDGAGDRAWPMLWLVAALLGAGHAIQPGHGKTLVAASALGPGGGPLRGAALGLATATAHLASVALIALAIWGTRSTRLGDVHLALARLAGFAIAAVGCWRLGHHLAGFAADDEPDLDARPDHRARGILALGLAGGIVPCWDAVALVVLSAAIGRLALGLTLLAAFSLGMAAVLVAVGAAASKFRATFDRAESRDLWGRRFGIAGGAILAVIGLSLMSA